MTTYVALLRGINVSGKNSIRMPALQNSISGLGFRDVQTYLQSGNIVFRTDPSDEATLAASIKTRIEQDFGHEVPVLVLSAKELDWIESPTRIANSNPFWPQTGGEEKLFHCTFLFQPVAPAIFQTLSDGMARVELQRRRAVEVRPVKGRKRAPVGALNEPFWRRRNLICHAGKSCGTSGRPAAGQSQPRARLPIPARRWRVRSTAGASHPGAWRCA